MNQPSRLYINSFNGVDTPNESPDNFQVTLKQSLRNVSNIELNSFTITFTPFEPNISPAERTFRLNITRSDGSNLNVTGDMDTQKIYNSPNDFATELNRIINSQDVEVTFDPTLARMVITDKIQGGSLTTSMECPSGVNSVNRRLGLQSGSSSISIANSGVLIMPAPPIIIRSQVLYLSTPLLCNDGVNATSSNSSILSMIQLESGAFGSIENFALQNSILKSDTFTGNIQTVTIQVLDDLYQPIRFCANTLASCEFAVQYDEEAKDNKTKLYI